MKITRKDLFTTLSKVLTELDEKNYKFVLVENNTRKKMLVPGGYINETYQIYEIVDDNNNIILKDDELLTTQECFSNYKGTIVNYNQRLLEDVEIKNLLLKKVMEYPELVKFYELLKVVSDYNYENDKTYVIDESDQILLTRKMKTFSKKYGHATDYVNIINEKRARTKK